MIIIIQSDTVNIFLIFRNPTSVHTSRTTTPPRPASFAPETRKDLEILLKAHHWSI